MSSPVPWPPHWRQINDEDERLLLGEALARELMGRHILFGQAVAAFARRVDADDVLFRFPDGRIAEVHLSWSAPSDPSWPATRIFADLQEWLKVEN